MKRGAASTPTAAPSGPTSASDLLGRVAEAAADVEDPLPLLRRDELQRDVAVCSKSRREDFPELDEGVEEGPVPGLNGLRVDARSPASLGGVHGLTIPPLR